MWRRGLSRFVQPLASGMERFLCSAALRDGLAVYVITSLFVWIGASFRPIGSDEPISPSFIRSMMHWDSLWYERIVEYGYSYDRRVQSTVAFFPAYPTLGVLFQSVTGSAAVALILVANINLAASFVVLCAYARVRFPEWSQERVRFVVLAFGLFPTSFFGRMAYSESTFLLPVLLSFYGMKRGWPALWVALLIGFATAARPVGVALIPAFLVSQWSAQSRTGHFLITSLLWMPLCCWGLLGYIAFQTAVFHEPFAFMKTQEHWRIAAPLPFWQRLLPLLTFEPFWGYFDEAAPCFWQRHEPRTLTVWSGPVLDRLTFLVGVGSLLVGCVRGCLTKAELHFAFGVIAVAYLTRAYEMCFASMGRFTYAAFPIYFVIGWGLSSLPRFLAYFVVVVASVVLAVYAGLFASNRPIF